MKIRSSIIPWLLVLALGPAPSVQTKLNPIEKVVELLSGLQSKLIEEGTNTQKAYTEFANWCEDRSRELHFEIKTGKSESAALKAAIDKGTSDINALEAKISDSASDVGDDQSELKEAAGIRKSDKQAFVQLEKELIGTISELERAISVLSKQMKAGTFLQANDQGSTANVVKVLKTMVEASSMNSIDASKLTALVQSQTEDGDSDGEDGELDMLAAPAHKSQSGSIVETLQGLLEKTEAQLSKARKEDKESQQEYAMKKQSLEDSVALGNKQMVEAKTKLAGVKEKKAVATGELTTVTKDLKEDIKEAAELHRTCLGKATAFQQEVKARDDELKTLAEAKKIIGEMTGDATQQTYGLLDTSFVQVSSKAHLSNGAHALRIIRRLAYAEHSSSLARSSALAQLASRMQSSMRLGSVDGENPFEKVQGMVTDMLGSLQKEAEEDQTEKEYCDKELAETKEKLDDETEDAGKLGTRIDQREGKSAKLKTQVATLQKELAALAKAQAEMTQMRQKEQAAFEKSKAELEEGLSGVQQALKVLKEYYAQPSFLQSGSASKGPSAILALLETSESDFSKLLAEIVADEEQAQYDYDNTTQENEVAKTTKQKEVSFKTKEFKSLDKAAAELQSDLGGVNEELSAVTGYKKQLTSRCVAKPESYEERKKRRENEIAGLKDALSTLGDGSFLEVKRHF